MSLPGRNGITPLSAAAYMGSVPIVELLMEKGADPKTIDNTNKAAIVYAAGRGFPAVVRVFLDHGVDVNARYGHDLTALMWAAGHSDEAGINDVTEEMTLFLDRGAHIDDQDDRGRTALMEKVPVGGDAAASLQKLADSGHHFVLVDAPADTLLKLSDSIKGKDVLLFNVGAEDVNLRQEDCRANVLHTAPDRDMRFTDYYAEASCTAGRANFITGELPIRTGMTTVGQAGADVGLPAQAPTIATALKAMGYTTGQFGKNHLGDLNKYLPCVHGFDEFFGYLYHLDAMEPPRQGTGVARL